MYWLFFVEYIIVIIIKKGFGRFYVYLIFFKELVW